MPTLLLLLFVLFLPAGCATLQPQQEEERPASLPPIPTTYSTPTSPMGEEEENKEKQKKPVIKLRKPKSQKRITPFVQKAGSNKLKQTIPDMKLPGINNAAADPPLPIKPPAIGGASG